MSLLKAPYRSFLYVPATSEKLAIKAANSQADVVIFDLEDAVPQSEKQAARELLPQRMETAKTCNKAAAVRINNEDNLLSDDLKASIEAGADIVILPKIETAESVHNIMAISERHTVTGELPDFIALIETPNALLTAPQIAASHPQLKALNLGTEDFSLEMGMIPEWDSLLFPSQQIVLAARSAGKIPLGYAGSIAQFRDVETFSNIVKRSAKLGFEGGFAIHPNQIAALNDYFAPADEEIARAQRIVSAFEEAQKLGQGAIAVDGKMIDRPVFEKARRILERSSN